MAILVMHDGTKKKVSYGQGATIYQILLGNKEPENKEQEKFVLQVGNVIFDEPSLKSSSGGSRRVIEHDNAMDEILTDPKLKGRDLAKAVADRLKSR